MVSLDTTGDMLTVTGTETYASSYYIGMPFSKTIKKESKEKKRTRLALEKNRASWVQFNEPKPKIKQVFKPINNFNKRR